MHPSSLIDAILESPAVGPGEGLVLGRSREGRPVMGFRFGFGAKRISLLGGCHADEPVGPRLLRHLCGYLASETVDELLLAGYTWWIVPHLNPDGEERNRVWCHETDQDYDIAAYLAGVVREQPGDDIEFGFPRDASDDGARPENRAVYDWWRAAGGPFALHVSLHGMAFAAGPWFLIDEAWTGRCDTLMARCTARTRELGYALHDVERLGEKGFVRLARGFTTRPDSRAMRRYFLDQGDEQTAALFRPSSMEAIRAFGGDSLTLVSEMPLFITPGVGDTLGPPDPVAAEWRERLDDWRARLADGTDSEVRQAAAAAGLRPMPVRDQMLLQWAFIAAGMEAAR